MKLSRQLASLCAALTIAAVAGAGPARVQAGEKDETEPDQVKVQHILIGFKRSIPGRKLDRTKKEAESLANELLQRARAGEDFLELVTEYSSDRPPGILRLLNTDVPKMPGHVTRDGVVPGFGDTAFRLEVGEIALVEYNFRNSPYGWHVIKRLE